jgi:prepilin-type N-terminal cleavage/methylation domain-containing protein
MTRRPSRAAGFTLVEVLVAASMSAVVMVGVLSSFIFLGRNLTRLANHQALENEAREALGYLQRDFRQASAIKPGTTPTAGSVTLVLPAGEVTYTFDAGTTRLRRQATFGPNPDFLLLSNDLCRCTSFGFSYFTGTDGSPEDQLVAGQVVPLSVKRIQVGFVLQTPATHPAETRTRYELVSARYHLRNKRAPDGT